MAGESRRIKKKKALKWPIRSKIRSQLSNSQSFNRSSSSRREKDDSVVLRNVLESVKGNNFQLAYSYQNEKLKSAGLLQETIDLKKKLMDLQNENSNLKSKAAVGDFSKVSVKNALDAMHKRLSSNYKVVQSQFLLMQQTFENFTEELDAAKEHFWEVACQIESPPSFNSSFRSRRSSGGRTPRQRVLPMVAGMQISTMPSVRISRLNPAVVHRLPNSTDRESSSDSLEELASPKVSTRQKRRASRIFQPRRPQPVRPPPIVSVAPRHSIISEASFESSPEQSNRRLSEARVVVKRLSQEEIDLHSPEKRKEKVKQTPSPPERVNLDETAACDPPDLPASEPERLPQESIIDSTVSPNVNSDTELVDSQEADVVPLADIPISEPRLDNERSSPVSVSGSCEEPELAHIFRDGSSSPEAGFCEPDGVIPRDEDLDFCGREAQPEAEKRDCVDANLDSVDELWGDFVSRPKKVAATDPLEGTSSRYKVKKPTKFVPVVRVSSRLRNAAEYSDPFEKVGSLPEFSEPNVVPIKNPVVELRASRASARIRSKSSLANCITPEEDNIKPKKRKPTSRKSIQTEETEHFTKDETVVNNIDPISDKVEDSTESEKRSSSDKENDGSKRQKKMGTKKVPRAKKPSRAPARKKSTMKEMQTEMEEAETAARESLQETEAMNQINQEPDESLLFPKPSAIDDSLFGSPNLYDCVKKRRLAVSYDSANSGVDESLLSCTQDSFSELAARRRPTSAMSFKEPNLKTKLRNTASKK